MNKISHDIEQNNCLPTKENDVRKKYAIVTFISQLIKSCVDVHVKILKDIINSKNNNNKIQEKKKIPKQFSENATKTFECYHDLPKIYLIKLLYLRTIF